MPVIHQLPPDLVAKIAAGEVIERPAAAVKELVENSLDAGATRIDVELEAAGTELIRIVDDGCGIAADDMPLAFAKNATSKLKTVEDLFDIHTMGFRGEALASIAGVAQVLMQSRPHGEPHGHELRAENSSLSPVKPWGGPVGTRIEVRHLFYNIPARKKFLKGHGTELGHVSETLTRLALANPHTHFVFKHNGKLVWEVPASATLKDRIGLFFGKDVRDALYEVDSGPGPVELKGYVADPKCDKGNAKLQYLFVNGRWFRDRSVGHALQEAYRGLLMTGRYAVGFLFLTVPPESVDVNVHPTKAEVRFRENSVVYSLVRSTVKARLLKENLVPALQYREPERDASIPPQYMPPPEWRLQPGTPPAPSIFSPRREIIEESVAPWEVRTVPPPVTPLAASREPSPAIPQVASSATPQAAKTEEQPLPFFLPPMKPGSALQVHDSYIVLETPEGMLVIDQHALHERILYEQLRNRIREGKLEVQRLLIPLPMELPVDQAAAVLDAQAELAQLGLDVSDFGGNTILLSSYPALLGRKTPQDILKAVVDELVGKERAPSKEALLNHLLATMACKAAVKAGDRLNAEEIAHLLELRKMADDSHHCPHGRPTSLLFSRQQLDKQFGRT
jgi:DNA mismatch repair protein MutL